MNIITKLEQQNKYVLLTIGILLAALTGFVDILTGNELAFSVFYVLPIALVTWLTNRRFGLILSAASAIMILGAAKGSEHFYSHLLIPYWNAFIRFTFFVILTMLVSALRNAWQREREHARTDYLTGAVNIRFFYELLQMEIDRLDRYQHPFTIAYFDLDNFKSMNDRFGHSTGDRVLQNVAHSVQQQVRRSDTFARIGGDEFALLLPETDYEAAQIILPKIRETLLTDMNHYNWPVTFSIGVLTCNLSPESAETLIQRADNLMYTAKRNGKNKIEYAIFTTEE